MTSFGDDLRASLKKKSEQLLVRQMQEERQLQAAKRQQDETRRAAEEILMEVLRPLLVEFREVMEAAGVLCAGKVESPELSVESRTADNNSQPSTLNSQLVIYRAMGSGSGSPHYEIRIACSIIEDRIEVSVHCVDRTAAEFGGDQGETALLSLPAKSFKAQGLHHDAIRDWCAGLLKKSADACMEANRGR